MSAGALAHVFVYGSLRRGLRSHHELGGARCVAAVARTADRFQLLDLGPYPGAADADADPTRRCHPLVGEVYEVGPRLLARLDRFEGVPDLYLRQRVKLSVPEASEAWIYLIQPAHVPRAAGAVEGGDWVRHVRARGHGDGGADPFGVAFGPSGAGAAGGR